MGISHGCRKRNYYIATGVSMLSVIIGMVLEYIINNQYFFAAWGVRAGVIAFYVSFVTAAFLNHSVFMDKLGKKNTLSFVLLFATIIALIWLPTKVTDTNVGNYVYGIGAQVVLGVSAVYSIINVITVMNSSEFSKRTALMYVIAACLSIVLCGYQILFAASGVGIIAIAVSNIVLSE